MRNKNTLLNSKNYNSIKTVFCTYSLFIDKMLYSFKSTRPLQFAMFFHWYKTDLSLKSNSVEEVGPNFVVETRQVWICFIDHFFVQWFLFSYKICHDLIKSQLWSVDILTSLWVIFNYMLPLRVAVRLWYISILES